MRYYKAEILEKERIVYLQHDDDSKINLFGETQRTYDKILSSKQIVDEYKNFYRIFITVGKECEEAVFFEKSDIKIGNNVWDDTHVFSIKTPEDYEKNCLFAKNKHSILAASVCGDILNIDIAYTNPEHRGRGSMTKLVESIIHFGKIECNTHNETLKNILSKCGWKYVDFDTPYFCMEISI